MLSLNRIRVKFNIIDIFIIIAIIKLLVVKKKYLFKYLISGGLIKEL